MHDAVGCQAWQQGPGWQHGNEPHMAWPWALMLAHDGMILRVTILTHFRPTGAHRQDGVGEAAPVAQSRAFYERTCSHLSSPDLGVRLKA